MDLNDELQKTPTLPTLPPGLSSLLQVLNQGDIHFVQLAKEIENFPNIAAKIIAVANSAWFSPVSPITSLLDACSRLGLNTVRNISIALSLSDVFDSSRCIEFDSNYFWCASLLNAEAASLYAEEDFDVNVQTARTTGLLYNIGLLWLAYNKPEETGRAIKQSQTNPDNSLEECLRIEMFTDHHITGGMLAQAMKLPAPLVNAITYAHIATTEELSPLDINMKKAHETTEKTMQLAKRIEEGETVNADDKVVVVLLNQLKNINAIAKAL